VGGNPLTPRGHIRLDANDIQEIILLSDELRLDELLALQCLVTGHDEVFSITPVAKGPIVGTGSFTWVAQSCGIIPSREGVGEGVQQGHAGMTCILVVRKCETS
jgi:hypothetical protein